jgi:hypothetical protein
VRALIASKGFHSVAAGVPLTGDEGDNFKTLRVGLFGLDKLMNADRTVESFAYTLDKDSAICLVIFLA